MLRYSINLLCLHYKIRIQYHIDKLAIMIDMKKLNVTIIVIDTLRYDSFKSLISKSRHNLSDLGNFVDFNKCIAPSSWTLPSHASLLTGMYPSKHGAHETREIKGLDIERIKLKKKTMVSDLKKFDYSTYAISANPYVHPVYGFDEFDDFIEESYFTDILGSTIEISGKIKPQISKYRNLYGNNIPKLAFALFKEDPNLFFETVSSSLKLTPKSILKKFRAKFIDGWPLEKGGKNITANMKEKKLEKPFFLLINLMEAHDPYTGVKGKDMDWSVPFLNHPTDENLIKQWKRLYKKASEKGYEYAYRISKDLVEKYGEEQIIVITSDHGQEFNEQGFIGHGTVLHDEVVKVPLAMILPKSIKEGKAQGYQSLVNMKRFILSLLNGANDTKEIFSKTVYSESFGVPANLYIRKDINIKKLIKYDNPSIRKFQ